MVLIIIVIFAGVILLGIFLMNNAVNTHNILWHFKNGNVIVCGAKGKGKDLLFQWVINKRKDYYYSNIDYGGSHKIIPLINVSVAPNTYDNLINDKIEKTLHKFKENKDFYISDGGNFLPSQMDSMLHKRYPSMPIFYSLSRHLYDSNVHVNTQNIERVWKALREQADFYIKVRRTRKIFGFLVTTCITYDNYKSCVNGMLPLKKRHNKISKSQYDLFTAQYGDIRKAYVIQRVSKIRYNTRAFEKVLLKGRRHY